MKINSFYPKISIVTPSFNQGQYIEQTIQSIVNQNYPNLQYIVIDGGSTDNTIEIIKKYERYIDFWVSETDKGQSDALNKGLLKCTGEIFNWINSDDYLEPGALFKIAKAFTENPWVEVVCGYARMFNDSDNCTILNHRCQLFASTEETMVQQKNDQQGMFYKLSALRQIGLVNTDLHFVMDLELWFRYLAAKGQSKFILIDDLLAHFRIHTDSKTSQCITSFREEEKMLWRYILTQLQTNKLLIDWFKTDRLYTPPNWDFANLDAKQLENNLLQHYFYAFYKSDNKALAKKAFSAMLKNKKLKFTFQNLSIFLKLYIVNLPFRKLYVTNA